MGTSLAEGTMQTTPNIITSNPYARMSADALRRFLAEQARVIRALEPKLA